MDQNKENTNVWLPFALSAMLAVGMIFGYTMNEKDVGPLITHISDGEDAPIGQVEELIRFIESKYVDSVSREPLIASAVEAVLNQLDPHSIYISKDQLARVNQDMDGTFYGIGIESYYIDDTVHITNVLENGPASRAGLMPFDKLIKIDNELVAGNGLDFSEIEKKLKGKDGDKVQLALLDKKGENKTAEVTISDVPIKSVDVALNITEEIGYIKINRFSSKTYREFMDHFERMYESGTKHLVIDLRGNPGGYLPEATNILSQLFSEKGKLLVYTEGKEDKKLEYKTTGKPFFRVDKIAVLIDEGSASGSEIIAGAIQEWDRGVIIGRRSFGKGLVQEQYDLQNGGALRITVARYYTPSGRSIQRTYSDKEEYDNDLYDRIHAGELFSSDSIVGGDTTRYKTLLLGREVQGGGGITPDVFVPLDSIDLNYTYINHSQGVNRFVYECLSDAAIKGEELNVKSIWQKYLDQDTLGELGPNTTLKLQKDIEMSLLEYKEGEEAMYQSILNEDPFIKLSIKYLDGEYTLDNM